MHLGVAPCLSYLHWTFLDKGSEIVIPILILLVFPPQSSVPLGSGLKPPVTYSVQFNSDTREFPESNCSMSVCTGTFTDLPAEDFDFAVVASNGLGNGRASPSMRGGMDHIS